MNAKELFISEGAPAGIWFCGECRNVAKTQSQAEECCKKYECRICGEPVEKQFWTVHPECRRNEQIERAEKLDAWDGWVYLEGFYHEFFESVGALVDEIKNDGEVKTPEYVFICKPIQFHAPSVDRIIEWSCDDHYEDASEHIKGEVELSLALQRFEAANHHIISYEPDFTKMVRVREA